MYSCPYCGESITEEEAELGFCPYCDTMLFHEDEKHFD